MRNGLPVFDADAHVIYPPDLWSRFLDARYVDRVDRRQPIEGFHLNNPVRVDGRYTQHDTVLYGRFQEVIGWTKDDQIAKYGTDLAEGGFTGETVAAALSLEGIDVAMIYGPEYDMWYEGIDPAMQAAMCRAYNRWGQEMYEQSGHRVLVSSPVPLNDVGRAVEEIRVAYEEYGARSFWTRPNDFNGRTLGDRYYDPIWEVIQDLDVAFATHEFMGLRGRSFGADRYRSFVEWHATVHQFEAMGAMMSMIVHGVFERFPRLRVAYLEAGCGWVPSWLHRVDEQLEMAALEFPELTMSATEYFRRNGWISTECEDPFVVDYMRVFGDRSVLYESDFPHPDSKYPHATDEFMELLPDQIPMESKRAILWDNPMDFYRLPPGTLPAELEAFTAPVSA